MKFYILKGKKPKEVSYSEYMKRGRDDYRVTLTTINDIDISTVFLGMEHIGGMLFETMIFGGSSDGLQWRYKTWEEAERGHKIICKMISEQPEKKIKRHLEF